MRARARALVAGALVAPGLVLGAVTTAAPAHSATPVLAPDKPGKPEEPGTRARPDRPGGDRNGKSDKPGKKQPKPDRKAPARPSVGSTYSGAGGYVSVSISAEAGSRVVVRSPGGGVVASGTGTGGWSSLGWSTSTGSHSYVVRATDDAGNTSRPSSFSVYADATAPSLRRVEVKPGNRRDTRTRVGFFTDAGSSYRVLSGGEVLAKGTTGTSRVRERIDLGNGRHQVTVEVRDKIGNTRTAGEGVAVAIDSLVVKAEMISEPTHRTQVIAVDATPNARRAVLRLPGEENRRVRMRFGNGDLKLRLPDGTHAGGVVRVRDSQGRIGRVRLPKLVVDTTPPSLEVSSDPDAAAGGSLALTVAADKGDTVSWQLLDGDEVVESGEFVSDGGERTVEEDVDQGSFRLAVSATDGYDRTTTDVTTARIGEDPTPVGQIALVVLAMLVLTGGLAAGAVQLRRHPPAWGGRVKDRVTSTTGSVAARARAVAAIPQQRRAQEIAEERWLQRHDELTGFLRVAAEGEFGEEVDLPEVGLLPRERVLHSTPALLFEAATVAGDEPDLRVESVEGDLVVTTMRIAFVGGEERDWWSALVEELRHEGDDLSLVRRRHDDVWTGFEYADPELTRLYLDLTMAEQHGTKDALLARVEELLRQHESRRPVPPGDGQRVPADA